MTRYWYSHPTYGGRKTEKKKKKDRVVDCIKHLYVRQEGTEQVTCEICEKLLSTKCANPNTTVGQEPQLTSKISQGATKSQILRELL